MTRPWLSLIATACVTWASHAIASPIVYLSQERIAHAEIVYCDPDFAVECGFEGSVPPLEIVHHEEGGPVGSFSSSFEDSGNLGPSRRYVRVDHVSSLDPDGLSGSGSVLAAGASSYTSLFVEFEILETTSFDLFADHFGNQLRMNVGSGEILSFVASEWAPYDEEILPDVVDYFVDPFSGFTVDAASRVVAELVLAPGTYSFEAHTTSAFEREYPSFWAFSLEVPEPATAVLVLTALGAVAWMRRSAGALRA